MTVQLVNSKTKLFLITYDYGTEDRPHSRKVPHSLLLKEPILFAENIISMKCLDCNFESKFVDMGNKNGT